MQPPAPSPPFIIYAYIISQWICVLVKVTVWSYPDLPQSAAGGFKKEKRGTFRVSKSKLKSKWL